MNIQYFLLARAGACSSPGIYRSALWLAAVAWSIVSLVTPAVLAAVIGAVQESHSPSIFVFCSVTLW